MDDVFISYAREDRGQAARLARALKGEGLRVWWDEESLRSGSGSFSVNIDKALEDAKRILVLWSPSSIESNWVDAEALHAWDAGKLHSVWLAHDVQVRVPFNASHARNLANWDGSADFPEFRRLLADIRARIGRPEEDETGEGSSVTGASGGVKASGAMGKRRMLLKLLALAAPTAVALAAALVLMQWRLPTAVKLDLLVDRVALTVAAPPRPKVAVELIDQGGVRLVQAERVASVRLDPAVLEVADESRYDLESGRFTDDAWRPLQVTGETLLVRAADSVQIEPSMILQSEDATVPGSLKTVSARAETQVVMALNQEEGGDQPLLTLDLAAGGARADLVFPASFLLFAESLDLQGAQGRAGSPDSLSLRVRPGAISPMVRVLGSERGLVLQAEPADTAETLLAKGGIPVSVVDFTRQSATGERRSTLIGGGELSYPGLPGKAPLALEPNEFVNLGERGLRKARIESISVDEAGGRIGLRLTLHAEALALRVGTREHPRDARLTWFDRLRHQPTPATLFAIAIWFFSTTLAGYKLLQELRPSRPGS